MAPGPKVVSHVALFGEQQQDDAAAKVRVVKAHKDAVLEALARAGTFANPDELTTAIALAVLGAEDHSAVRYCVVTQTPAGEVDVFGPYLNAKAAEKARDAGWAAWATGSKSMVLPLTVAPKVVKRKAPASPKKKTRTAKQRMTS